MIFEFILLEPQYKHYNLIQHRKKKEKVPDGAKGWSGDSNQVIHVSREFK